MDRFDKGFLVFSVVATLAVALATYIQFTSGLVDAGAVEWIGLVGLVSLALGFVAGIIAGPRNTEVADA